MNGSDTWTPGPAHLQHVYPRPCDIRFRLCLDLGFMKGFVKEKKGEPICVADSFSFPSANFSADLRSKHGLTEC